MARLVTLKPRIQAASLSRVAVVGEASTTTKAQTTTRRSRLYDLRRWRTGRVRHLREHPLCVACQSIGKVTAASVVDHRTPHKGSEELFFDESNWQSMCVQHHNEKTAAEDGGFGNAIRKRGHK